MNGSRLKFLAIGKISLVPKFTPNPRVLGIVWSSYGEATPTQENPRNKQDQTGKQIPKSSTRNSKTQHGITHWMIRRTDLNSVGSTDEQSRQQRKQAPVDPTQWFELRRFNRRYTPDDPAKSKLNAGAVVQRGNKTRCRAQVKPMLAKSKHRCSCPESLQHESNKHWLNR